MTTFENLFDQMKRLLGSLAPIPESEWPFLKSIVFERTYRKGDSFCQTGEVCRESAFIGREGLFEASYTSADGSYAIMRFYSAGQAMSSYRSLLTQTPSELNYVCLSGCTTLILPESFKHELYQRHPSWIQVGRVFGEIAMIEREHREKAFLLKSPEERYLEFKETNKDLLPKLSDKQIAAYLGITNVSLSRIKGRLAGR